MKNVDLFIAYLSGELKQEERSALEKELTEDPLLRADFDQVSAAFFLIRDQLQERDEAAFKKQLEIVMEQSATEPGKRNRRLRRGLYVILPLAASVALVLAIFLGPGNEQRLFSGAYHPESDQVLQVFMQGTRGKAEMGILYYQQEKFLESMKIMEELMAENPDNLLARLFYLLSAIESAQAEVALNKLLRLKTDLDHQLGQAISWYTALALLRTDQKEETLKHLQLLIPRDGPYQSEAIRLEKILLK